MGDYPGLNRSIISCFINTIRQSLAFLFSSCSRPSYAETKASLLRFSIAYALKGVRLHIGQQFYKLGLTEAQRREVAASAVEEMRKYGEWKDLDEEILPPAKPRDVGW
jgi:hypothetical protein